MFMAGVIKVVVVLLLMAPDSHAMLHDDTALSLASCVGVISERYFEPGKLLILSAWSADVVHQQLILDSLHQPSLWSILLQSSQGPDQGRQVPHTGYEEFSKAHSYTFLTNFSRFPLQLQEAHAGKHWSSRGHFLIIVTDTSPRTNPQITEEVRQLFITLWQHKVFNAVVLIESPWKHNYRSITDNHEPMFDLYTWFPFDPPDNCGRSVANITLLDRWLSGKPGRFLQDANLYPQKIPRNLHGCPLYYTTIHSPPFVIEMNSKKKGNPTGVYVDGLEIEMLRNIAKICNLTLIYVPYEYNNTKWGIQLENGTWTGVFSDLQSERVNVTFSSFIPTVERYFSFDFTRFYLTNSVAWVVPSARIALPWYSLYRIFSPLTWVVLVVAFSLVVVVIWFLANRKHCRTRELSVYRSALAVFHTATSMQLGLTVPPPRTGALRLFFLLFSCYCLWVTTAYQSSLISSLMRATYNEQITTESQLLRSHLPLAVVSQFDRLLSREDPVGHRLRQTNVLRCEDLLYCLRKVADGHLALVGDKAWIRFVMPSFPRDGRGQSVLNLFQSNIFSYFVGMALPKGSLYLESFNHAIFRLHKVQLISKWRYDLRLRLKSANLNNDGKHKKTANRPTHEKPRKLTFGHLQAAFILLIARCAFAFVVFIGEIVYFRKHQRRLLTQPQIRVH